VVLIDQKQRKICSSHCEVVDPVLYGMVVGDIGTGRSSACGLGQEEVELT
jgi:hypothetical protein